MIESATGIILRTRPLTETSLIVLWLTPNCGRISTVAKGARRPRSPFLGKLDLFYEADFLFSRSRRSELHPLREVSLRETNSALRQELGYLQQAGYGAALIQQATETETPLPAVFDLFRSLLGHLPKQPTQPQTIFAFELKLLCELGLKPDLVKSRLTPGAKQIVNALWANDWSAVARLKLSESQMMELRQFLHGFLIFHLGRIPKGRMAGRPDLPETPVAPKLCP
jgi:DNA repair protein RecO (recombination protein O)